MSDYLGMFELTPLYDGRKSFYGKAFIERWNTEHGMQWVLKSYGTVVARVTPTYADGDSQACDGYYCPRHRGNGTLLECKECEYVYPYAFVTADQFTFGVEIELEAELSEDFADTVATSELIAGYDRDRRLAGTGWNCKAISSTCPNCPHCSSS